MRISDWSSDVCSSDLATSAQLSETVNAAAAAAGKDKRARLIAYVTANFQPPVANPTLLSTWIAFWSLIKTDPVIAAIHSESYAAFRSDLESLLTDCGMIPARAGPAAIALTAMIDGLWLELSLDSSAFTPKEDRKNVVLGKGVELLVGLGGGRIL